MTRQAESKGKEKSKKSQHAHAPHHGMSDEERNSKIPKHIMEGIKEVEQAEHKIAQGLGKIGTQVEHKIQKAGAPVAEEIKDIKQAVYGGNIGAGMKKEIISFFRSFREIGSLKMLLVSCFDLLFYFLMIGSLLLISFVVMSAAAPLVGTDPSSLIGSSAEDLSKYQSLVSKVTWFLILGIVLAIISFIISYVLSRALVWTTLLKKRLSGKYFGKFILLNLIWLPFWIIILLLLFIPVDRASQSGNVSFMMWYSIFALGIYMMISSYFTYLLYYIFTGSNEHKVFYSLKEAIVHGAKDIGKLWFPALLILVFFALSNVFSLIFNYFFIDALRNILSLILMIVVFSFIKIYAVSAIDRNTKLPNIWA